MHRASGVDGEDGTPVLVPDLGRRTGALDPGVLLPNRLIGATTPEGVVAYVYNADGLRVRQTFTPNGGVPTTTVPPSCTGMPSSRALVSAAARISSS